MHSSAAYNMLEQFRIGFSLEVQSRVVKKVLAKADPNFLDFDKPLIPQMISKSFDKKYYLEQVHIARHLSRQAQLFGSPFWDRLTKTSWWVIPFIWFPISFYLASVACESLSRSAFVGIWVFGLFGWTLVKYVFHRFIFHIDGKLPNHQAALTLHFLLHGIHHLIPMDHDRLVMPPVLMALLCFGPWVLINGLLGMAIFAVLYSLEL